jgi:hypothetical protein
MRLSARRFPPPWSMAHLGIGRLRSRRTAIHLPEQLLIACMMSISFCRVSASDAPMPAFKSNCLSVRAENEFVKVVTASNSSSSVRCELLTITPH